MEKRIWFITGISSGLGKAIADTVIEQGDFVIGTFRNLEQADAFNALHKNNARALVADITNHAQVQAAYEWVKQHYGRVDVLVNNAGYGFAGAIEEATIEEVRNVFEANFFGALYVTQTFLPMFRQQKRGHIIQISSHGGVKAFAGFGIYNASKFALEGMSEALAQELAPLGIKVTIAEPGPFRTNFAANGFQLASSVIDDYAATAGVFRDRIKGVDGKQEGDPLKAAKAIYDVANLSQPPLRLPLGKVALSSLASKLESVQADMDKYRHIAEAVVY
jgi:NAD(P)-dependent dehydrogenase (short-subunit alcohol dehydrogenase family)